MDLPLFSRIVCHFFTWELGAWYVHWDIFPWQFLNSLTSLALRDCHKLCFLVSILGLTLVSSEFGKCLKEIANSHEVQFFNLPFSPGCFHLKLPILIFLTIWAWTFYLLVMAFCPGRVWVLSPVVAYPKPSNGKYCQDTAAPTFSWPQLWILLYPCSLVLIPKILAASAASPVLQMSFI